MNKVWNGLSFTLAHLDDVIIFSETAEQHLKHIQIVLTRLKQANLKLKKKARMPFSRMNFTTLAIFLQQMPSKVKQKRSKQISEMKAPTYPKESENF